MLAEGLEGGWVHVGVVLVFAAHAPAEAVGLGAYAGVDGPAGTRDGFAVFEDEVAGLVGWAHEVEDAGGFGKIEVEIDFRPAVVGVGWHGVPDAAGFEVRYAHD